MGKITAKKPKGVGGGVKGSRVNKKSGGSGGGGGFKQSMRLEHSKFGQHLLRNPAIVEGMVERAAVRSTDTVLEVDF